MVNEPVIVGPGTERKQLELSVLGIAPDTRRGISYAVILTSFSHHPQLMSNNIHGGDPRKLRNMIVFLTSLCFAYRKGIGMVQGQQ